MKRVLIVFSILIAIIVSVTATMYYILSKLTYKFVGFNFSSPENDGVTGGLSLPSINDIQETIAITFVLTNASIMNLRITNFNLKVKDEFDREIGAINTINEIFVPKQGENSLNVSVRNIDTNNLIKDFLSGKIKRYKYTVSGRIGGFIPFRYTSNVYTA